MCGWEGNFRIEHGSTAQPAVVSSPAYLLASTTHVPAYRNFYISSPEVSLKARTQLTFYYRMLDAFAIKRIQLFAMSGETMKRLWQLDGVVQVPANVWLPARVSLCITGTFILRFEGSFR